MIRTRRKRKPLRAERVTGLLLSHVTSPDPEWRGPEAEGQGYRGRSVLGAGGTAGVGGVGQWGKVGDK